MRHLMRILLSLSAVLAIHGAGGVSAQTLQRQMVGLPIGREGAFDPSLASTEPNARSWFSYSAVDPSLRWGMLNSRTMTTRLAYSDSHGAQWRDAGLRLNEVLDVEVDGKKGSWVNEVSSLVYDPRAPASDRWQLYWHHYLSFDNKGDFSHGWLAYKGANTPEGLQAAHEVKLFSGRIYHPMGDGSMALSPLRGTPLISNEKLGLDCLAFTEPGGMATRSGVYLSLQCVEPAFSGIPGLLATMVVGPKFSIVLLKCDAPCQPARAQSWRYIGTPLTAEDAKRLDVQGLVAPDLYMNAGTAYLMVSPMSNTPVTGAYNGCWVMAFTRLDQGIVERSAGGAPVVSRRINGNPGSFNGACTYQPSVTASGFMYGEVDFARQVPFFQIYQTGSRP
jgi:hypothetical protein